MTGQKSEKLRVFESLILGHMEHLHRFGVYLSGSSTDADDLVQETYLKAFRHWESFDPKTNVRAWLFMILKNSFINLYRKKLTKGISVEYVEGMGPHGDGHTGTTHAVLQDPVFSHLLDDDVVGALSDLPEKCRTVLILSDIEEMPYAEIADFLNCPVGTVRSRLHRARRSLRLALARSAPARGYGVPSRVAIAAASCAVGQR
jgi:RNA polymerase sigma-70 factor (ECF subfamily)